MTIKDILELGFGIDFNTLSFNLIKDDFDSKTTVNAVKNMLENYPITIPKEYFSKEDEDYVVDEVFGPHDFIIENMLVQLFISDEDELINR